MQFIVKTCQQCLTKFEFMYAFCVRWFIYVGNLESSLSIKFVHHLPQLYCCRKIVAFIMQLKWLRKYKWHVYCWELSEIKMQYLISTYNVKRILQYIMSVTFVTLPQCWDTVGERLAKKRYNSRTGLCRSTSAFHFDV